VVSCRFDEDPPSKSTAATLASSGFDAKRIPFQKRMTTSQILQLYIVEDSRVILDNLVETLEELAPVKVAGWAPDESTAVSWLTSPQNTCHLVIIDIFLKSGTGLGVLKILKDSCFKGRSVVLTNYATNNMRERCKSMGASRVFDKSNELDELISYCNTLSAGGGSTEPGTLD
jgi:DNA-binding NarL/FixJ family response regulator